MRLGGDHWGNGSYGAHGGTVGGRGLLHVGVEAVNGVGCVGDSSDGTVGLSETVASGKNAVLETLLLALDVTSGGVVHAVGEVVRGVGVDGFSFGESYGGRRRGDHWSRGVGDYSSGCMSYNGGRRYVAYWSRSDVAYWSGGDVAYWSGGGCGRVGHSGGEGRVPHWSGGDCDWSVRDVSDRGWSDVLQRRCGEDWCVSVRDRGLSVGDRSVVSDNGRCGGGVGERGGVGGIGVL